jgi:hypothetical protein
MIIYPTDTLRGIFNKMNYAPHHLGRRAMGSVRVMGETFEFETHGNNCDVPIGELLEEGNWEDNDVCITFDAGEFLFLCVNIQCISIANHLCSGWPIIGWLDELDEDTNRGDLENEEDWDADWRGHQELLIAGFKMSIGHPNITNAELRAMQDDELQDRFVEE